MDSTSAGEHGPVARCESVLSEGRLHLLLALVPIPFPSQYHLPTRNYSAHQKLSVRDRLFDAASSLHSRFRSRQQSPPIPHLLAGLFRPFTAKPIKLELDEHQLILDCLCLIAMSEVGKEKLDLPSARSSLLQIYNFRERFPDDNMPDSLESAIDRFKRIMRGETGSPSPGGVLVRAYQESDTDEDENNDLDPDSAASSSASS